MKKTLLLAVIALTVSVLHAQQQVAYTKLPSQLPQRRLSRQELEEGLRFWHKVVEEAHVNMNHSISRQRLALLEKEMLENTGDSITHEAAVLLFGRLGAALNEGHIGLPSARITDSLYGNSLRFPYLLQRTEDDAWIVAEDISQEQKLSATARILRINNRSITELNRGYRQLFGGLDRWRAQQVAANARKLLYLDGVQSPFNVTAVTATGDTISFTVRGFDKLQGDSINKALAARRTSGILPYNFKTISGNIGYIDYRSMVNNDANPFSEFLEKTFTAIDSQHLEGLIIDLRENGGGNSRFGEHLISYFSDKPYRLSAGMKWKVSQHYKEYLASSRNPGGGENNFYISQKNGDTYKWESTGLNKPAPQQHRFSGKVAVLIGANTFSSANMLADGIKTYQLARVFGEASGEPPNDFGEMFNFMLPNSGIIARGSSKLFKRADGDENNFEPVQPDVLIKPTADDIIRKKDVALEAAMTWIKEKQTGPNQR